MKKQHKIILKETEYCYVINKRNGKITMIEGPVRLSLLNPFKRLYDSKKYKKILEEDEYAIISNVYNHIEKKIMYGDREIILGPIDISLHYGESISSKKRIPVLTDTEGIVVKCVKDFNDNKGINHKAGEMWIIKGPIRYIPHKYIDIVENVKTKIILEENEYAIILNPYDKKEKKIQYGDRKIVFGPLDFALHYEEEIFAHDEIPILNERSGLIVEAVKDFTDNGDVYRKAGERWTIKGPIAYKPHKYVNIVKHIKEISLAEHDGIYIKNTKTGDIRLEKGIKTILLSPYEELWEKDYTKSELDAINLQEEFREEKTRAFPLWVLEKEVTKIMSKDDQKIIFGPRVILLEPHERPYIMSIAGGTPKNDIRLKIWKIKLGPNFSTDIINVRTKDNAVLSIKLRYQWKFIVDYEDPEKIYGTNDFIGLMTEMMASIIRDTAAKHDFEELHSRASEIIKEAIFDKAKHYEFENGLRVFGIDIKEIKPKDEGIANRLNEAIKSNMEIYVNKMKQHAKIEAEKTKIEGQKVIEEKRIELIKIENENLREQELIKSKIDAEQIKIKAEAEAKASSVKSEAKIEAITKEIEALKKMDKNYLKLRQIESLNSIKKMAIVPTDSKLFLPIKELLE